VIALDERGRSLTSEAFAAKIATARDAGTAAASLIIGGADGLSEEMRDRADLTLAFGA
jgi:23S rRNA (pseudouridine1915-N3)-methyltransferase